MDSAVFEKLTNFVSNQFERYWVETLENSHGNGLRERCWGNVKIPERIRLPIRPSPSLEKAVVDACKFIVQLPSYVTEYATRSFKKAFKWSMPNTPDLVTLLDAHYMEILLSSLDDHNTDIVSQVESIVLTDPVDQVIYRQVIRRSAVDVCVRNQRVLEPLLVKNPAFAHAVTCMGEFEIVQEADLIDKTCDRFSMLPVQRQTVVTTTGPSSRCGSAPQHTVAPTRLSTASLVSGFNTNTVTSFFNSVGKITLGGSSANSNR
jgi:hypothetical protein